MEQGAPPLRPVVSIFRWLCVLPAASLGAVAAYAAFGVWLLVNYWLMGRSPGMLPAPWFMDLSVDVGRTFGCPFAWVWVGAAVAPAYRLATAISLSVLWAMGAGLVLALGLLVFPEIGGWPLSMIGVRALVGGAACVTACYQFRVRQP